MGAGGAEVTGLLPAELAAAVAGRWERPPTDPNCAPAGRPPHLDCTHDGHAAQQRAQHDAQAALEHNTLHPHLRRSGAGGAPWARQLGAPELGEGRGHLGLAAQEPLPTQLHSRAPAAPCRAHREVQRILELVFEEVGDPGLGQGGRGRRGQGAGQAGAGRQ